MQDKPCSQATLTVRYKKQMAAPSGSGHFQYKN